MLVIPPEAGKFLVTCKELEKSSERQAGEYEPEPSKCSPWAESHTPPDFVDHVLLKYSHAGFFVTYDCFLTTVVELRVAIEGVWFLRPKRFSVCYFTEDIY